MRRRAPIWVVVVAAGCIVEPAADPDRLDAVRPGDAGRPADTSAGADPDADTPSERPDGLRDMDARVPRDAVPPNEAAPDTVPAVEFPCCEAGVCRLVQARDECGGTSIVRLSSCEPNPCDEPDVGCDGCLCSDDGDCPDGTVCEPTTHECRDPHTGPCGADDDDSGENDDIQSAERLMLAGFGHAEVRGRVVCPDNPDFFGVELEVGERMQAVVTFDDAVGAASLRFYDVFGNLLAEAVGPESPHRIRYPDAPGAPADTIVYVEVSTGDPVAVTYDLEVVVVDPFDQSDCWPDRDDLAGGMFVALPWNGRADQTFDFEGTLCPGDEDWFSFQSPGQEAGLAVELTAEAPPRAVIEVYNEITVRNLGQPSFVSGLGEPVVLDVPAGRAAMSEGEWYVRVRGPDPGWFADAYTLSITLRAPLPGCMDQVDDAVLEQLPGFAPNGALPRGVDLQVPLAPVVCFGGEDTFQLTLAPGERLRAWANSADAFGQITVDLLDAAGGPVGRPGRLTGAAEAPEPARLFRAAGGDVFVRVRSVGRGEADPYTLFVRVDGLMGCGVDVAEGAMRNDTADDATALVSIDPDSPRYELDGLICNAGAPDRDWYALRAPGPDDRICVVAEFDAAAGPLSVSFLAVPPAPPPVPECAQDGDCDPGLRCVRDWCVRPWTSHEHDVPGFLSLERLGLNDGEDTFVMVEGLAGAENEYLLTATVPPSQEPRCHDDWREVAVDNNDIPRATELGADIAGVCDAWLCNDERAAGDWYVFDVLPGDGDRSILATFEGLADGEVILLLVAEGPDGPVFFERWALPDPPPRDARGECINLRPGALGGRFHLQVAGDAESGGDQDNRIDYTLRILPTDLDADPDGRCLDFVPNLANTWTADLR